MEKIAFSFAYVMVQRHSLMLSKMEKKKNQVPLSTHSPPPDKETICFRRLVIEQLPSEGQN